MASPAIRHGEGQPHPLKRPRVVARGFQPFDVDSQVLQPQFSTGSTHSLGQQFAKALPVGNLVQQLGDAVHVSVIQLQVQRTPPGGLDGEGGHITRGDCIQPQPVADVVEVEDLGQVVHGAQSAKGEDGLVLRPLYRQASMTAIGHGGDLATGEEAAVAGLGTWLEALHQHVGADLLPVRDGARRPVIAREGAHYVGDGHHHRSTVVSISLGPGIGLASLSQLLVIGLNPFGIVKSALGLAVEHNPLYPFGAHYCPHACAAGVAAPIVGYQGERDLLFAGWADDDRLGPRRADRCLQGLLGLVGIQTPEGAGIVEGDSLVGDLQIDWLVGGSLQQDGIVTGGLDARRNVPAGVGFAEDPCLGRFGEQAIAAGRSQDSARGWANG